MVSTPAQCQEWARRIDLGPQFDSGTLSDASEPSPGVRRRSRYEHLAAVARHQHRSVLRKTALRSQRDPSPNKDSPIASDSTSHPQGDSARAGPSHTSLLVMNAASSAPLGVTSQAA